MGRHNISQHDLHFGEMTVRETLDFMGTMTRYWDTVPVAH